MLRQAREVKVYRGRAIEVSESFVASQGFAPIRFDVEQKIVNKEWATRSSSRVSIRFRVANDRSSNEAGFQVRENPFGKGQRGNLSGTCCW